MIAAISLWTILNFHAHGPEHGAVAPNVPVDTVAQSAPPREHTPPREPPSGRQSHAAAEKELAQVRRDSTRWCGPLAKKKLVWTRRMGPIALEGTVVVGPGKTLILEPGVEILVAKSDRCPDSLVGTGPALVVAGGTLQVNGSARRPVLLRPQDSSPHLTWEGIRLEASPKGRVEMRWMEIRQARTGLHLVDADADIAHVVFEDCGLGLAAMGGSSPRVSHSVFHRSRVADVVSARSAPLISGSLFLDGLGDGIRFDGVGMARLEHNGFHGHRGQPIVRGIPGMGGWASDTVPDRFGNWRRDPVLRDSDTARSLVERRRKTLDTASWWVPRRALEEPPGTGPFALSAHSPLLDKAERTCRDADGSACDIGLWSGR